MPGNNITGVITAINNGIYTIQTTQKDGTTTNENIKFDTSTKFYSEGVNINPHGLPNNLSNQTNPLPNKFNPLDRLNPQNRFPKLNVNNNFTQTPAPTLSSLKLNYNVRVKVKISPDGTMNALHVHLVPSFRNRGNTN
jgi:hypothetical protein